MRDNCAEIQRLTSNLNAVRQIRFRYESKVFQYNKDMEYFTVLLQEISTKRVQYLSFVMEMPDNWADDFNDEVKQLYLELKKSYKESADFFSELHKMATDKLNEAKIISSQISERKKRDDHPETQRFINLEKLLPEINNSLFNNSTFEQWKSLINNDCLEYPIRISAKVDLKDFVYFFDNLKNKVGFKISNKDLIRIKAFCFEGVLLKYEQVINARRDYKKNGIDSVEIDKILK